MTEKRPKTSKAKTPAPNPAGERTDLPANAGTLTVDAWPDWDAREDFDGNKQPDERN